VGRCDLHVRHTEDAAVVSFAGAGLTLDDVRVHGLRQQLMDVADGLAGQHLVLDLANVTFLACTTLGLLVTLHQKLKDQGACLVLCHVRPSIAEVFAVTRLNELFEIRDAEPRDLVAVG
jgi:anti-sigma B factor antagonist